MSNSGIGKKGEDFCANYYLQHGYSILFRNYHSKFGEIDVIAQNESFLVFIEVKTRAEGSMLSGADAVDEQKQKKCMLTALAFLNQNPTDLCVRFDVFEVVHKNNKLFKFRKLESAFDFDESKLRNIYY